MLKSHAVARLCWGDLISKVSCNGHAVLIGTIQGFVFLVPHESYHSTAEPIMLLDRGGETIGAVYLEENHAAAIVGDRRVIFWEADGFSYGPPAEGMRVSYVPIRDEHDMETCTRTHIIQDGSKALVLTRGTDDAIVFCLKTGEHQTHRLYNFLHIQSIPLFFRDSKIAVYKPKGEFSLKKVTEDIDNPQDVSIRIHSGESLENQDDYFIQGDSCFLLSPNGEIMYSYDSKERLLRMYYMHQHESHSFFWRHGMILSLCFCDQNLVILDSACGISISSSHQTLERYVLDDAVFQQADFFLCEILWFQQQSKGILMLSTGRELYHITGLDWML